MHNMNLLLRTVFLLGILLSSVTFSQTSHELRRQARRGDVVSMRKLGKRLIVGENISKDVVNGVKLIKMAADKGDSVALLMLGDLSRQGIGMPKNLKIALQYYKKAEEAGNEAATKRLAKYGEKAETKEPDNDKAGKNSKKKKSSSENHTDISLDTPQEDVSSAALKPEKTETKDETSPSSETPEPAEIVNVDENLLIAAKYGNYEGVKNYLQQKANINHKTDKNETALTLAAKKGYVEIVKLLLDSGADISYVRNAPWCYSSVAIAKLLVAAGANVNWETTYSPVLTPWCITKNNPEMVKFYIEHGADFNKEVEPSALVWCLRTVTKNEEEKQNQLECLRLMLEAGAKPSTDELMFAAERGHTEAVSMFLKAGADPTCVDSKGYSALLYAALNGHAETAHVLREAVKVKE